jgi:hypothetical protein
LILYQNPNGQHPGEDTALYQYFYPMIGAGSDTPAPYFTVNGEVANVDLTAPVCEDYTNYDDCKLHGCYWYNGGCHSTPPTDCSTLTPAECADPDNGCYYWGGSCQNTPAPCAYWTDETSCESNGCYWYNGSCHATLVCEDILNATDCRGNGCFWYNGACHSTPADCTTLGIADCVPNGCYWYDDGSGTQSCHPYPLCDMITDKVTCTTAGCYWYNNACHGSLDPDVIDNQIDCEGNGCIWYNGHCYQQITCEDYVSELDCTYPCFWYNGACHSTEQQQIDWTSITIIASAVGIIGLAAVIRRYLPRRKG